MKKTLSLIKLYLTTSAYPANKSFLGKVLRVFGSINTAEGWKKVPIRFFPNLEFIAVFPPTELSTWDKRVVGIWINFTPLNSTEDKKPVKSPTTPPPKA